MRDNKCENCGADCESFVCEECCENDIGHEFDSSEGFMCLNCGREGLEDMMADAYDRAKAARYDD